MASLEQAAGQGGSGSAAGLREGRVQGLRPGGQWLQQPGRNTQPLLETLAGGHNPGKSRGGQPHVTVTRHPRWCLREKVCEAPGSRGSVQGDLGALVQGWLATKGSAAEPLLTTRASGREPGARRGDWGPTVPSGHPQ